MTFITHSILTETLEKHLSEKMHIFSGFSLRREDYDTFPMGVVCEALQMSREDVISIIKSKGYTIRSNKLTKSMLDVLADNYVENLHKFFLQASLGQVINREKYNHFLSFRKLYKHENYRYIDYAEAWEQIDEHLVRQTLFNRIEALLPKKKPQNGIHLSLTIEKYISDSIREQSKHPKGFEGILIGVNSCFCPAIVCTPLADDSADESINTQNLRFNKSQKYQDYLYNVLCKLTSDPTTGRSKSLTPKARGTCSGLYVRRLLSPHRYCIFGSSDDEPASVIDSECIIDYMNCSYGMGKDIFVLCRRA